MKPFDLEKALAGEPVVTRDGRPVTQVAKFKIDSYFPVAGVLDDDIGFFTESGKHLIGTNHPNDLFMATKTVKKEGWVNLHKTRDGVATVTGGRIYDDLHIAIQSLTDGAIATVKIEWEEEI